MQRLERPDSHYLNAAMGWLALGCRADAQAELEQISPEHQRHPDVLEVRWEILAKDQQWEAALDVARKLLSAGALDWASGLLGTPRVRRIDPAGLTEVVTVVRRGGMLVPILTLALAAVVAALLWRRARRRAQPAA